MKHFLMVVMALISMSITAQEVSDDKENLWSGSRPDGHAPISVMGDHYHGKGEWMFSYRLMNMSMGKLQKEKDEISNLNAHSEGYMVTPKDMDMKMHMIGAMYAPSDKVTLMVMANIIQNDMNLQMRNMNTGMIMPFSTSSSGFGDIKVAGLFKLFNKNKQSMLAQVGFSIPTGSIEEKDMTPMSMGNKILLPYPMQLGSGTFDTTLGLTYLGQSESISWGNQLKGEVRLGKNDADFSYGNNMSLNNWIAFKASNWLSLSARIEGRVVGKISGENEALNPMMVTTADTKNSGATFINSGIGFNTYVPNGSLKNLRLGFEFGYPLYQKFNGIQLKNKETITVGLQYSFK